MISNDPELPSYDRIDRITFRYFPAPSPDEDCQLRLLGDPDRAVRMVAFEELTSATNSWLRGLIYLAVRAAEQLIVEGHEDAYDWHGVADEIKSVSDDTKLVEQLIGWMASDLQTEKRSFRNPEDPRRELFAYIEREAENHIKRTYRKGVIKWFRDGASDLRGPCARAWVYLRQGNPPPRWLDRVMQNPAVSSLSDQQFSDVLARLVSGFSNLPPMSDRAPETRALVDSIAIDSEEAVRLALAADEIAMAAVNVERNESSQAPAGWIRQVIDTYPSVQRWAYVAVCEDLAKSYRPRIDEHANIRRIAQSQDVPEQMVRKIVDLATEAFEKSKSTDDKDVHAGYRDVNLDQDGSVVMEHRTDLASFEQRSRHAFEALIRAYHLTANRIDNSSPGNPAHRPFRRTRKAQGVRYVAWRFRRGDRIPPPLPGSYDKKDSRLDLLIRWTVKHARRHPCAWVATSKDSASQCWMHAKAAIIMDEAIKAAAHAYLEAESARKAALPLDEFEIARQAFDDDF